jgi:hypothetical protein
MARQAWTRRGVIALLVGLTVTVGLVAQAADDAIEARMRKDITFLASPECEGRGVETQGINKAADFIAAEFKKAGLKPVEGADGYFQPFTMYGTSKLEGTNTLVLKGPQGQTIELPINEKFRPLGLSGAGKASAPVVFAGYGATAKGIGYDDYNGVGTAGRVVIVLRRTPRADNQAVPFDGANAARHAALKEKVVNADQHKAAAVLFVNDRGTAQNGDPLMEFRYTSFGKAPAEMPVFQLRRSVADQMVESSLGKTLRTIEEDIDRDLKPRSTLLEGWTATVESNRSKAPVRWPRKRSSSAPTTITWATATTAASREA